MYPLYVLPYLVAQGESQRRRGFNRLETLELF
jgi:hypothetical protein